MDQRKEETITTYDVLDTQTQHHALPHGRPPIPRSVNDAEDIGVHLVPLVRRRVVSMGRPTINDDNLVKHVKVARDGSIWKRRDQKGEEKEMKWHNVEVTLGIPVRNKDRRIA